MDHLAPSCCLQVFPESPRCDLSVGMPIEAGYRKRHPALYFIIGDPIGPARDLKSSDTIGKRNECLQRNISAHKTAAALNLDEGWSIADCRFNDCHLEGGFSYLGNDRNSP